MEQLFTRHSLAWYQKPETITWIGHELRTITCENQEHKLCYSVRVVGVYGSRNDTCVSPPLFSTIKSNEIFVDSEIREKFLINLVGKQDSQYLLHSKREGTRCISEGSHQMRNLTGIKSIFTLGVSGCFFLSSICLYIYLFLLRRGRKYVQHAIANPQTPM